MDKGFKYQTKSHFVFISVICSAAITLRVCLEAGDSVQVLERRLDFGLKSIGFFDFVLTRSPVSDGRGYGVLFV